MARESAPARQRRTRAALYMRVSTDAQFEEGYSIEQQKEMLEAYCKAKRIEEYECYIDPGFSGSNIERPAMQNLIRDIREGRITHVLVYKLDRLSRSQKDTLYLIEDVFNTHDVTFTSLNENFDTSTPTGKAMLGMMSVFAQLERETIRERTRMGMLGRLKEGYWPGGARTPFGYDYDSAQGTLVPNADAARVERCFELLIAGYSPDNIARMLGFKYDNTVRNILGRKTYLGLIEYNGVCYPGRHAPLVSQEVFARAQRILDQRAARREWTSQYLLTGLLVCGRCGAKMRYQKWGNAGVKIVCYSQQRSKPYLVKDPDCDAPHYWADEIEQKVIEIMMARRVERSADGHPAPIGAQNALDGLRARLEAEKNKLKRLYALYASGDDALLELIDEQRDIVTGIEKSIAVEEEKLRSTRQLQSSCENISTILDAWDIMNYAERRAVVLEWINAVIVSEGRITVDFKF